MAHEYLASGIPFLRSQDIKPYRIDFTDITYISEEFHQKIKKSALQSGDVVIVRTGRPDTSAVIPETLPVSNCSDMVVVRPGSNLNARYLCYYINSIAQDHVSAYSVRAVQQHYNVGSAKELKLLLPPLPEQQAIARILGALDDKIELNRRMNHTLEEMTRALFKSWFVDFDPVTAKVEGQVPLGMNAETASLFPAEFEETEDGSIPKGWKVGSFKQIAEVNSDSIKNDYPHKEINYIDISSVESGHLIGMSKMEIQNAPSRARRLVKHGDTIWSCVTTDDFVDYLTANAEGSAYPAVRPESFERASVLIPPDDILKAFEKIVKPLFELRYQNACQMQNLASIRDALLPKLLSGELRVKQAEKVIENM
jgi:type I restriction enzyme S subunit